MRPETLLQIKKEIGKFRDLYEVLVTLWNGKLEHGNSATYPITIVISVILHNMAFIASNTYGYNHDKAVADLRANLNALYEINKYEGKSYMTHLPFNEVSTIIEGYEMGEDWS